jgi:hypothetical protein
MRFLIIEQPAEFEQQLWTFDLSSDYNPAVRLVRYSDERKPTKRHKWRVVNHWDAYDHRNNTLEIATVPALIVDKLRLDMSKWVNGIPIEVR